MKQKLKWLILGVALISFSSWADEGKSSCTPISSPLSFVITGVTSSGNHVFGGHIPSEGVSGYSVMLMDIDQDLPVTSMSSGSQIHLSRAENGTIQGTIVLSPIIQDAIARADAKQNPAGKEACVSQVAIKGYYYNDVPGFAGTAYLYLNNSQRGYALPLN
jgi:hypothetical protein